MTNLLSHFLLVMFVLFCLKLKTFWVIFCTKSALNLTLKMQQWLFFFTLFLSGLTIVENDIMGKNFLTRRKAKVFD